MSRTVAGQRGERAKRQAWMRYGVALLALAAATLVRLMLNPVLGPEAVPYPTFFCAILVAFWFGGLGPGLLAVGGGWLIADLLFVGPMRVSILSDFTPHRLVGELTYLVTGLLICVVADTLMRGAAPAQRSPDVPPEPPGPAATRGVLLRDYTVAVLSVGAAIGLRLSIPPSWGMPPEMMFAALAVAASAVLGGMGPGLLAVVLSAVLWPLVVFHVTGLVYVAPEGIPGHTVSFLITGVAIAYLGARGRTLRTRQLAAARQTELLLANINDAYQVLDAEQRVVYINAAAQRILRGHGVEPATVLGKHLVDAYPTDAESAGRVALLRALDTRQAIEVESWYQPWRRWLLVRANPLPDGGTAIIFQDITRRRRSDTLLDEQRKLLEKVATGASKAACMLALTEAITRMEPSLHVAILVLGADGLVERSYATHVQAPALEELAGTSLDRWLASDAARPGDGAVHWPDSRGEVAWSPHWEDFCRRHAVEACTWKPVHAAGSSLVAWCVLFSRQRLTDRDWHQDLGDLAANVAGIVIERERVSQALRASESRFRALVLASSDIVYRMNADWTEMRALERRGVLAEVQLPSRDWMHSYIPPEDQALLREAIERAVRGGTVFELEHRVVRHDGSIGWIFSRAIPIHNAQGEVSEWFGTAGDVTRRKLAELALRESEERFRTMANSAPVLIWVTNERGEVEFANRTYLDFFDVSLDQVHLPQGWHPLVHPDDRVRSSGLFSEAIAQARAFTDEARVLHRDGTWRWIESTAMPRFSDGGAFLGHIGCSVDVDKRKQAERALRESEALLSAVLQQLPVGLGVMDPSGRWLLSNAIMDAFVPHAIPSAMDERRGRWRATDQAGRPLAPSEWPGQRALRGEVLHPGLEMAFEEASGRERWLRVSAAPLRDDAGAIVGATAILEDIDAVKRAEMAYRRSQGQLELVANTVPALISYVDTECRYQMCNRTYLEWFGLSPEEIVGRPMWDVLGASAWEQIGPRVRRALEGQTETFETEARYARGGTRWIQATYTPHRDEAGKVLGLVIFVSDLTARKVAEDAIRRSEARYRSLVSVLTDIPWSCDREGRFVTPQPAWENYTGQSREQYQEHGWREAIHPDDREALQQRWDRARDTGQPFVAEGRVWHAASREYRYFSARATPMPLEAGGPAEWVGTYTDIDDRIRADRELRAAKERAEAAGRAKDDFIAALSHELRTPLTPVLLTTAELAVDPTLSPEVRQQLAMMRDNIELETRLIDDLLDLTHIARGSLLIHPVVTNVHTLLAHTQRILAHEIAERSLHIGFEFDAPHPHVRGDPARLQQVFWNLVRNALKFTPTRGRILVQTRNPEPDALEIVVEDSGIGINPASIERIFNAFDQGDLGQQHRFGGLGLGLAIAKAIVDLHEGTLRATSEGPGRGARFTVRLAAVPAPGPAPAPQRQVGGTERRLRLLLVDDHEATRTILTRMLTRDGHIVFPAGSLREARAVVATQVCDAVISDLGLPDGSGCELMLEIKSAHGWPGLALSGYGQEEDVVRSREAGFSAHLTKPVDGARLRRALAEITRAPPLEGAGDN